MWVAATSTSGAPYLEGFGLQPDKTVTKRSVADFIATHIGAVPSNYSVSPPVRSQLFYSLYSRLLSDLPTTVNLLPSSIGTSIESALLHLQSCDWKLSEAQKRAIEQERIASDKGKQPLRPFDQQHHAEPDPSLELGPEYGPDRKGMPCGHVFAKGEAIYRCRDCGLDDTVVQCAPCFNSSIHVKENHDVVFSLCEKLGGCCDCGDDEAWTSPVKCQYHSHDEDPSTSTSAKAQTSPTNGTDADVEMDESNQNDDSADRNSDSGSTDPTSTIRGLFGSLQPLLDRCPPDVASAVSKHVGEVLDFILDALEHAPDEMLGNVPPGEADQRILDLPTLRSPSDVENPRLYSLVLWNDETHTFSEVISKVMEVTRNSTRLNKHQARGVADGVDAHGRQVIRTSASLNELTIMARKLTMTGREELAVSIRPAYDIFAEDVAGLLLDHIFDLANATIFVPPVKSSIADPANLASEDKLESAASTFRALLTAQFLIPWNPPKPINQGRMSQDFFNTADLRRLDGIFLLDNKMWKEARKCCQSILLALTTLKEIRREIAFRFAQVYAKLCETFILKDREPEQTMYFLAVQLFTVPSIALELVTKHGFLEKMLQIMQVVCTMEMPKKVEDRYFVLPPVPIEPGSSETQFAIPGGQRCLHLFYHLRYLITPDSVQRYIVKDPKHLQDFISFLLLFNAVTPDKRATDLHVEYESQVWFLVFQVMSRLGGFTHLFASAYAHGDFIALVLAINATVQRVLEANIHLAAKDVNLIRDSETRGSDPAYHDVDFAGQQWRVLRFRVDCQPVSFHHPIHWLLAGLFRHSKLLSKENLEAYGLKDVSEILSKVFETDAILAVMDFPLRVYVKITQVRSGLWVRNGHAIRQQAFHYREVSMRDTTYDQDLFLLQCGLILLDQEQWLVTIMDRFDIVDFFRGEFKHRILDGAQLLFIVEEFLLLLIGLFSEPSKAAEWEIEQQLRREVVHALALGQGTFTEVTRLIAERLTEDRMFERILNQVSNFRAPDGTNDFGIYELKDEYYDEVQPFFFHYSRNQREKVEEALRARQRKKGIPESVPIGLPKKMEIPYGPFADGRLTRTVVTPAFTHILFMALSNVYNAMQDVPDTLVEATLQLILIGLVEQEALFAETLNKFASQVLEADVPDTPKPPSILALLCRAESDTRFKAFKPRISYIIDQAAGLVDCSQTIQQFRQERSSAGQPQSAEDAKKAAAKARQAAIMQQFQSQQKNLLETFADEDDEDMDDETYMEGDKPAESALGSCILCQEELDSSQAFGSLVHVQTSRVMRLTPYNDPKYSQQIVDTPLTLDRNGSDGRRVRAPSVARPNIASPTPTGMFPTNEHRHGIHASTCGHLMHVRCFASYCHSVELRHNSQVARNQPEDLERFEFLCPLCESLGNVLLPPAPPIDKEIQSAHHTSFSEWLRKVDIDILKVPGASASDYQDTQHGTGTFLHWYAEDAERMLKSRRGVRHSTDTATFQMLDRLVRVINPLSAELLGDRKAWQARSITALPSQKLYLPEELVAYTVSLLEVSQRGMGVDQEKSAEATSGLARTVAGSLSEHTVRLLSSLLYSLRTLIVLGPQGENGLADMRRGLIKRLLPHWGLDDAAPFPLLLRDPLTILVETAIVAPDCLEHVTSLMYYATIVQVIYGIAQSIVWSQGQANGGNRAHQYLHATKVNEEDIKTARQVFPDVKWLITNVVQVVGYVRGNLPIGIDQWDEDCLAKTISSFTLPFLRRAAIIRSITLGLDSVEPLPSNVADQSEYIRLLTALKIPVPSEALPKRGERQTPMSGLIEGWIRHASAPLTSLFRPAPLSMFNPSSRTTQRLLALEHPHIYELVALPEDLAELLQQAQKKICNKCGTSPLSSAICLLCGEVQCCQMFCCQTEEEGDEDAKGECYQHMAECGGAVGLYFKSNSNCLLLLYHRNGSFLASPYLDTHGEMDIGLSRRGRLQKLHMQRYDEVRKHWLGHTVATVIARKLDAEVDEGGWTAF
ncbi:E3 ubiquitin-protein ligase ubr1 [Tilletia horrida]|uniref:E3 ubiquitin-protein ligase n=1 Tax=Tilletia horrida TaxID=155126 RepID=A0AAN6GRT4_9BASI|nr:E3 ubiquitin-protein ligase ubr1 [Tilletia horrida]